MVSFYLLYSFYVPKAGKYIGYVPNLTFFDVLFSSIFTEKN